MAKAARAQMQMASGLLALAFAPAPDGTRSRVAPREFRIFAPGENALTHGTFIFTEASLESILQDWRDYGNRLSFDYGHSFHEEDSKRDPEDQFKSAGLFGLAGRNGELWAVDIDWTPSAKQGIESGEWPFTSPAFLYDGDTYEITGLVNIALTSTPATKHMRPLCATRKPQSEPQESPVMKTVLAALALTSTATEAEALEAVTKTQTELASKTGRERELLTLCDAKSAGEALGKVEAWKQAAAQTSALQTKVAEIELASKKSQVEAMVKAALVDGKIGKDQVETFTKKGLEDFEFTKGFLATAAKRMRAPAKEPGKPGDDSTEITAEPTEAELALASVMNTDPKKVAALRAQNKGRIPTRGRAHPSAED